jgi:hypothetical protein
MYGESLSVINSTYYINKEMLCPRNNDTHRIKSYHILNSLGGQAKTCVSIHSIDCEVARRHFLVESVLYLIYIFYVLVKSRRLMPLHTRKTIDRIILLLNMFAINRKRMRTEFDHMS